MRVPIAILTLSLVTGSSVAELRIPPHFSDHMVVQQGEPFIVHGWAEPGATVSIRLGSVTMKLRTESDGTWRGEFPAQPSSAEGRPLVIRAERKTVRFEDVVIGEVWLCSGQSNMYWRMNATDRFDEFRAESESSERVVRMFDAALTPADSPQETVSGSWTVCAGDALGDRSAVAYHFGRVLADALEVPIGLVHASWGGSKSEAWTSPGALAGTEPGRRAQGAWEIMRAELEVDPLLRAGADVDESDWTNGSVPGRFDTFGVPDEVNGVAWYRVHVDVPARWAGRALTLSLGKIDDDDVTWFGGTRVGATNGWQRPRVYTVPAEAVRAGDTVLAVRVTDGAGPGGLWGEPEELFAHPVDDDGDRVSLAGPAVLKVTSRTASIPVQHRPSVLHDGMFHPLSRMEYAGVIWYQGESNGIGLGIADDYGVLFPLLIEDWRRALGRSTPFLFVQLANLDHRGPDWDFPRVRDAQRRALELPYTGMAVTIDIGNATDIHPRNKHDVGDRLARWALVDVYGKTNVVKSGPLVAHAERRASAVVLTFDSFGSPLAARDGARRVPLQIGPDPDGMFSDVVGRIEGDTVVIDVAAPGRFVRYGWAGDPVQANLMNEAGLPASPFEIELK